MYGNKKKIKQIQTKAIYFFSHSLYIYRVNFKKNEKAYNSEGSEVLKALKESENDPPEPGKYMILVCCHLKK